MEDRICRRIENQPAFEEGKKLIKEQLNNETKSKQMERSTTLAGPAKNNDIGP